MTSTLEELHEELKHGRLKRAAAVIARDDKELRKLAEDLEDAELCQELISAMVASENLRREVERRVSFPK